LEKVDGRGFKSLRTRHYLGATKKERKRFVEKILEIIGDKWSLIILGELTFDKSPSRFNELMWELSPISSRTLSAKLAKLKG
jgi:DNA-binding HxlR family transcriptional regulator